MTDTPFDVDFLIVGSGFGGSVSALRLTEKGYRVRVLERGRRFTTSEFPKTNWDFRKSMWIPLAKCFGILRLTIFSDVMALSGAGVGGGSLVYANTLYVPPDAFFDAPQWSGMKDWKSELLPHYRMAQFMLGVTQNPFEGEPDVLLKSLAKRMNREDTYVRTPVAVYFGKSGEQPHDPYFGGAGPERHGCTFCGGCMVGCRHGAKNTLDKNYLYFAEKLGAEVEPMRTVTDVRALPDGGYAVTHVQSGAWFARDEKTVRARNVVLSAGVLGTVKILLDAKERGSLPNVSNQLGERVRTNSEAILGFTTTKKDNDFSRGVAITTSFFPDDNTHVEIVRYSAGSDALSPLATLLTDGGPGIPRPIRYLVNVATNPGKFVRSLWPFGRSKRGVFLLVMQTLDNSIALKNRRRWFRLFRRGMDTDRGTGTPNPTYIPIGNEIARNLANDVEGGVAYSSIPEVMMNIPTTAHVLGGAAIGPSPDTAVIDEHHQVYGHPGLYVVDGSMIPANLGVNPSLTITALAEHAMTHIPLKDGMTLRPALDPAFVRAQVEAVSNRARELGSDSLQAGGMHAVARAEAALLGVPAANTGSG